MASLKDFFSGTVPDFLSSRAPEQQVKSSFTTTVFSGTAAEWQIYLSTPWKDRRNGVLDIHICLDRETRSWAFLPQNSHSTQWAEWIDEGMHLLKAHLATSSRVTDVFNELLFENDSNFVNALHLHTTENLPTEATREVRFDQDQQPVETDIVLQTQVIQTVSEHMVALSKKSSDLEKLGVLWPVLRRLLSQLGYPSYPRDRFKDRILLTTRISFISVQVLFDGRSKGVLKENQAGSLYMDYVAQRDGIPKKYLLYRHPYFRMLNDLGYLVNPDYFDNFQDATHVIVRDFLDQRYLRISVAGVMPGMMEWMAPMDFTWEKKKKVSTESPTTGKFGILDKEDYKAWKKLAPHLEDAGFVPIRQLGIGQFGRVYEALNVKNGKIPQRVAVKVDRIRKGHKKEAIQAVETIMNISRGLSLCPHVIRIYDAGKLKSVKSTYHILQLVNGDTLDNLIGVTGTEHASVYRPPITRTSEQDLKREYLKAIRSTGGEAWRRERASLPFTDDLSLSQALDIMTSTLLWLEEVHQIGFAINDLKNGNLMISRRGQLKGIDLDTYSPVFTPLDKLPDFFFLAVTLLMFILRVFTEGHDQNIKASGLLSDMNALNSLLHDLWRFGDIEKYSHGRITSDAVLKWMVGTIDESRNGSFAHDPEAFTHCVDELIGLKRRLVNEEMVLD